MPLYRKPPAILAMLAFSALSVSLIAPAIAAPIHPFSTYDKASTATVETKPYAEIITALSVMEGGRTLVAYDVARAQALPYFQQYVDYLAAIPVETLNRDEQLAYWLNTRNVVLLQALAQEKRIGAFKRKRGTPQAPGTFWTQKRITVSNRELSLHDIEQDILFAGWDDANIMFGLYQAIEGGPALPRTAFSGDTVTEQLAEAGRQFVSSSRNLRIRGNKVRLSTYFDWYTPLAYGGDETVLRQHISQLVKPEHRPVILKDGALTRRNLSTAFEQYRTRQATVDSGSGSARGSYGTGS